MVFSERVRALSEKLGGQSALARQLKVVPSAVNKWTNGSADPDGPGGPVEICISRLEAGLELEPAGGAK